MLPEVWERQGASAIAVPLWAPPPTEGVAQEPPSWPTDKVGAARTVAAMPVEASAQVAGEDARVAEQASPAVPGASPAAPAGAIRAVALAAEGVAAVAVADTTNPPS